MALRLLTASQKKHHLALGIQINGNVQFGERVSICGPSEINGTGSSVEIHDGCDIAAYVVINVADSSDRCLGLEDDIRRAAIVLGTHVFVGSHVFIGGGIEVGHHTKIAAGTVLVAARSVIETIPPYSLVYGNPWTVREGFYKSRAR